MYIVQSFFYEHDLPDGHSVAPDARVQILASVIAARILVTI